MSERKIVMDLTVKVLQTQQIGITGAAGPTGATGPAGATVLLEPRCNRS